MSAKPTPAAPRRKRGLTWTIVAVVVLAAAGAGGWWWQAQAESDPDESAEDAQARSPAMYFALEPSFVVNLVDADSVRYLQADVQLMTRDADTASALELHAPAIRNRLLLLFSQQSAARLAQRSAKERLQEQALDEVRAVLEREDAAARVEAALFTSLVTQ